MKKSRLILGCLVTFFITICLVGGFFLFSVGYIFYSITDDWDYDPSNKNESFYTKRSGWDWIRVPLLEPYAALIIDPEIETHTWGCELNSDLFRINSIKHVAVQDSIIYVLSGQVDSSTANSIHIQNIGKVLTAWYVLDTRAKTKEEKVFVSEEDFLSYIKENNAPSPQWYHIDSLACMKKLPWEPE